MSASSQQACLLCQAADMIAVSLSGHVCCVSQQTRLLRHIAESKHVITCFRPAASSQEEHSPAAFEDCAEACAVSTAASMELDTGSRAILRAAVAQAVKRAVLAAAKEEAEKAVPSQQALTPALHVQTWMPFMMMMVMSTNCLDKIPKSRKGLEPPTHPH